ncbi:MAG TPA: fibronectin type III domain-containing protein, partial [Fervidobacterium sp.]|nr:fibronectin type III domain-containing protein [Fervidobacterium sp.]
MRCKILRLVTFVMLLIPLLLLAQQPPKAVSEFSAQVLPSLTEVKLTWKDNSTDEDGFRILRSTNNVTWTQIAVLPSNTITFTDKDLLPKTKYYYRIHAYNAYGRSDNVSLEVFTGFAPAQPLDIGAAFVSDGVRISWKDTSEYESGYIIERKIGEGGWQEIIKLPENSTEFIDKDISKGGTYYYRVYAVNELGKSAPSPIVSILVVQPREKIIVDNVAKAKRNIILAATNGGIALYDVSEPSAPSFLTLVEMKNAQSVFTYNNYAYVADGE